MAFMLFAVAFIKSVVFSFFGTNFFDYGETLHNAQRILQGDVLYRDIWAILPPGDNYFPSLIFRYVGENLISVRVVESVFFALFILVVFFVGNKIMNKFWASIVTLSIIFADLNSYLLFFNFLFLLAILFMINFFETKRIYLLVLSGFMAGVGTFFRHDMSLVYLLSISLTLLTTSLIRYKRKHFSRILLYGVGWLLPVVALLLFLVFHGTLSEFLYLGFVRAPKISRIYSSGFIVDDFLRKPFDPAYLFRFYELVYYFFFFVVLIATTKYLFKQHGKRKWRVREETILLLLITGTLSVPYALSVIEMGHLVKAGPAVFILAGFISEKTLDTIRNKKVRAVIVAPFVIFLTVGLIQSVWWIRYNDAKLQTKKGSLYVNSSIIGRTHPTANTLSKALAFIDDNSNEDDYIFAAPYHAMIYYLSDRKSPTKYNNFLAGFLPDDEQKDLIDNIRKYNVDVVVYDPNNAPAGKLFSAYSPEVHKYLLENYRTYDTTEQGWLLMKRK